jgi:signal transduction histidine kinase
MVWLIIILIIIIVVLLTFIFRYKYDIKYISKQIVNSKGEYCNIRMNTLNKDIEKLVLSINDLYEINQEINMKIKQNEEKLRLSIANMSHDLRTPLTSIMGYVQLIKDKNLSAEEKVKYINIVERRTESLQSLITSFYELSRIEADEYKFDLKSIDLGNILCETIALFYNDFVDSNIEPNINIEEKISPIICDEKAVIRIFSNLINNMLKHGEKNINISLKKENSHVVTEFTNNAPNLKKEDVEHIFDRFFTADVTRSDKNTGLGLSITKALVEQLGYKIEAILVDRILNIKIIW